MYFELFRNVRRISEVRKLLKRISEVRKLLKRISEVRKLLKRISEVRKLLKRILEVRKLLKQFSHYCHICSISIFSYTHQMQSACRSYLPKKYHRRSSSCPLEVTVGRIISLIYIIHCRIVVHYCHTLFSYTHQMQSACRSYLPKKYHRRSSSCPPEVTVGRIISLIYIIG
jgi:hypothetical protein